MQIPVEQCQPETADISIHKMVPISKIGENSKAPKVKSNINISLKLDIKTKIKKLKKTGTGKSLTRLPKSLLPNIAKPSKNPIKKVHINSYLNLAKISKIQLKRKVKINRKPA